MLFHILAFLCLAKAQRDENLSTDDDKTDLDQRRKPGWSPTIDDDKIPVIFDNEHTDGSWTSLNSTSDDSCTYVEQDDGSILINTMLLSMDPERILKLLTRRTLSQVYKMNESN